MTKAKGRKRKKKSPLPKTKDPSLYLNRELSWLEFNSRVLYQAEDSHTPLLERFRFLSIYTNNLDEFVMKRVGGIKRYKESDYSFISADGRNLDSQLDAINNKIVEDNFRLENIFLKLKNELTKHDIELVEEPDLNKAEKEFCDQYFLDNLYPILTPLSVDPGKPFPFISNLSYSFGIILENPFQGENIFSRVKVPELAREWVCIPTSEGSRYINGSEIIRMNLHHLYRGMKILDVAPFKITRNADWDHDDEDTEDLMEAVEESINERRLQEPIRLESLKLASREIINYLLEELNLKESDYYTFDNFLDFLSLDSIANFDFPELKFKDWIPKTLPWAQRDSLFEKIKEKDRMIHHPYESFNSTVEKFVVQASRDPSVLSIKMTLYRAGEDSRIIKSLIEAAENGKQVVCLIELKARFDERRNIYWARKMEQAGVHVVYGVVGLKTHSKLTLIVRQETGNKLTRYAHIATGNYNSKTAKLYTDIGILTANKKIVKEISEVFNYLTGTSLKIDYKNLLVAPINAKSTFIRKINEQTKIAKAGKEAHIIAKMNSLEDLEITTALYEASQAGVKIDLIVRGFCSLKPKIKGVSDNIRVFSVIGRFLEHSRIFYFSNGESSFHGDMYLGSADWMHRNMHNRVEVMAPIYDDEIKRSLHEFLYVILKDHGTCWELGSDGKYSLRSDNIKTSTHQVMMDKYKELSKATDL